MELSGLILSRRMPPSTWIRNTIHDTFTGYGWGQMAMVVDDEHDDFVIIMVAFPDLQNDKGAMPVSRFVVNAESMASRDDIERAIAKSAKKAVRSLAKQIEAEKAKYN